MEKIYDAIIIGSGPGGDTAGIYLARSGYKSLILEGSEPGGQLVMASEVGNYPGFENPVSGFDIMDKIEKQAKNLGVEFKSGSVTKVDLSSRPFKCIIDENETLLAKNLVIGTGTGVRYLGLDSEKKYMGKGVSFCATCDGFFYKKKIVAVIGGGRTAGIEALYLSNIVEKVYIVYRKDKFSRMENTIIEKINAAKNIELVFNSEVVDILGNDKHVTGIKVKNNQTNEEKTIELRGIFIAIGRDPRTEIFKGTGLELDSRGYIVTQPDSCRTNVKHVYAVGDVNNKKIKQAIMAASHGCMAAIEMQEDDEEQ